MGEGVDVAEAHIVEVNDAVEGDLSIGRFAAHFVEVEPVYAKGGVGRWEVDAAEGVAAGVVQDLGVEGGSGGAEGGVQRGELDGRTVEEGAFLSFSVKVDYLARWAGAPTIDPSFISILNAVSARR